MRTSDFQSLDINAGTDLVIAGDGRSVTLKNLVIVKAECVSPGYRGDGKAPLLFEITDRRWPLKWVPLDKGYNVRNVPAGTYALGTLPGGGTPWSWTQMVQDTWSAFNGALGAFPGLPRPMGRCPPMTTIGGGTDTIRNRPAPASRSIAG
jgi:hypothetical protein